MEKYMKFAHFNLILRFHNSISQENQNKNLSE